jgi:CshA-type fibril repeat protein
MKLSGKAIFAAIVSLVFSTIFPISASNAAQVSCTASPGYTHCIRVTYSGTDQTFTVPATYIPGQPLIVETWAAGGGGSTYFGAWTPNSGGAAGGYSKTVISGVAIGDTFTVVVGQGGIFNGFSANSYGGGGRSGNTTGTAKGSGGGGFSGIFLDSAKTQPLVIAGGGGGASPGSNASGVPGGGGAIGSAPAAVGSESGGPGTTSSGGASAFYANCTAPTAGAAYVGGTGAGNGEAGGGGGGGYFGGGGGACQTTGSQNGGGGGGSGYVLSTRAQVINSGNGANGVMGGIARPSVTTLPASGGQYVAGVGVGGGGDTANSGGHGMVVFQWSATTQPTFTCDSTFYAMHNATLKKMSISSTPRQPYWTATWTNVGTAGGSNFAAIAYNEADNYIYGTNANNQLVKIGSDGSQRIIDTLGVSMASFLGSNVNSSATYLSNGVLFFEGSSATNAYTFKVDTTKILPTVSLVGNITPLQSGITDISYINGFGYGIHAATSNLIRVDASTGSHAAGVALNPWIVSGYGATWTDGTNLFAQSSNLSRLYQVSNLGAPVSKQIAGSTTTTVTTLDGANCTTGGNPFPELAAPSLVADTSTGPFNTAQTISPLSNDSANGQTANFSTNSLNAASVKICLNATSDANCLAGSATHALSTITVANQGTYTVQANGAVLFTPVATYFGAATPIKYTVADSNGQYGVSTISVTVTQPNASVANPDTTIGKMNTAQYMDFVQTNDTTPAGVTLNANTVKLCTSLQVGGSCTVGAAGTVTLNSAQGTYQLSSIGNGRIGFTPTATFVGTASPITYQINDSLGRTVWSTYTPTVVGLPVLTNDTSSGAFGATQTISVLSNDNAFTGATLDSSSLKICTVATATASCNSTTLVIANQGVYAVNSNGTISFRPCIAANTPTMTPSCSSAFANVGSVATTAIKYVVADNYAQRSAATITPNVSPPTISAGNQSKSVLPSASVSFTSITSASGLASGTGLVTSGTGVTCLYNTSTTTCSSNNSVTISGSGTYTLVPATGVVTFSAVAGAPIGSVSPVTYRVTDAVGQTATGTLTAVVPPPPSASNDSSSGAMNALQTIAVTSNDVAGSASAPLDPTTVRICATTSTSNADCLAANLSTVTVSGQATYSVNSDGTITLVPVNNYYGTAAAVKYIVQDSLGQVAAAQLQAIVSPPPATRAAADLASAAYNTAIVFSPFANDSVEMPASFPTYTSVGSAALVNSSVRLCASQAITPGVNADDTNCTSTSVTTAAGIYVVNTLTGTITFTPADGFVGTDPTPPVYGICDVVSGWIPVVYSTCASAPLIATILAPAPPTANADTSVGPVGLSQSIDPLANDVTAIGVTADATAVKLCAANHTVAADCSLTSLATADGTYEVNVVTGAITFTPSVGFTGQATETIYYAITDSAGGRARASYVPTVIAAPVASAKTSSTAAGTSQNTTVSIPSGGSATLVDGSGNAATSLPVAGGTYSISAGVITFTPEPGFSGTAPAVTYQLIDAYGQSSTSTYTPTSVAPAAPSPVAKTSSAAAGQGQTAAVTIPAGGSVTLLDTNDNPVTSLAVAGGSYSLDSSTGVIVFVPNAGFSGTPTPISYRVTDIYGQSGTSTYTPTVVAPAAPSVSNKTSTAVAGATQTTQVTLVGSNVVSLMNGQTATSTPIAVTGGSYSIDSSTGLITFTPNSGFVGTAESVTYKVTDIYGTSSTATYTATVTAPAGPSANALSSTAVAGTAQSQTVLLPSGGSVTLLDSSNQAVTSLVVAGGTYTLDSSNGTITFTPNSGFAGTPPVVNYRVTDAYSQSSIASYAPVVTYPTAPTQSPLTSAGVGAAVQSSTANVPVGGSATLLDQNNNPVMTLSVMGGTYVLNPATGVITFTPASGFTGTPQSATVRLSDAYGQSVTSTYTPSVTATLPAPPSPSAKLSTGIGSATQSTSIAVPSGGSVSLLNAMNQLVTSLTVAGGLYTVDPSSGLISFSPNTSFTGVATAVNFAITDAFGQTGSSTYTPTVTMPSAPVLSSLTSSGYAGASQSITPTVPQAGSIVLLDSTNNPATTVTVVGGVYALNPATGTITFTPDSGFVGPAPAVPVRVTDAYGQTAHSPYAATVLVVPVAPPAPVVSLTNVVTGSNVPVKVNPTVTGSAAKKCLVNPTTNACENRVTIGGVGTFVLNADGSTTFTPAAGFVGNATVDFKVTDASGASGLAPINVEVAQLVELVAASTLIETAVSIKPVVPISTSMCLVLSAESACANTISVAGVGRFSVSSLGEVIFDPAPGFAGVATVFIKFGSSTAQPKFTQFNIAVLTKSRGPVIISIGNFADGSSKLTKSIKSKIAAFINRHNDYERMQCIGFTEGPTVLATDAALARARAVNACKLALRIDADLLPVSISTRNLKAVGAEFRRITIVLRDN